MKTFSITHSDAPEYLKRFLSYKSITENRTKQTVFDYYISLRTFFRWIIYLEDTKQDFRKINISKLPFPEVASITTSEIVDFLSFCRNDLQNNASKSIAAKLTAIREYYDYELNIQKSITINPAASITPPKIEKKLPRYLDKEDCKRLIANIDGEAPARDFCMILWMLHTGIRLSELVGINISDVNVNDRQLIVRGKGNKERLVLFNDKCIEAYANYMTERATYPKKPEDDALFVSKRTGKRITNRRVEQIVDEHLLKAGLEGKGISPHKLRHTAATNMYRAGVDVLEIKELLGHANLATTQIYTHTDPKALRATMSRDFIEE